MIRNVLYDTVPYVNPYSPVVADKDHWIKICTKHQINCQLPPPPSLTHSLSLSKGNEIKYSKIPYYLLETLKRLRKNMGRCYIQIVMVSQDIIVKKKRNDNGI